MKIECENLSLAYNKNPAITNLSVKFAINHTNAIVGPNGAGKSTLLKALLGEITPTAGTITLQDITHSDIAYLPQITELDLSVPFTVYDILCVGLINKIGVMGGVPEDTDDIIKDALSKVNMTGYENIYIKSLSKGQLQRILIAKIIVQNAKLIILDEPFNAIDVTTTNDLLKLITNWTNELKTIIVVLHDIPQIINHFDYTLLLSKDCACFGMTKDIITQNNINSTYHAQTQK